MLCNVIIFELCNCICDVVVKLMKNVDYINVGIVEFLVEGDDFYFIEVNFCV